MKKYYTGALAALAAGILLFTTGITGEAARTGTITTDGSRVRASADAEGQKVCSLPVDTIVDITDETQSGGKTWYQISFTLDGAQKTGWIRSDLLSVSETEEETQEQPAEEQTEEEVSETEAGSIGGYTIQEPEGEYEGADALDKTTVSVGEQEYTAYQSNISDVLYLVWISKEDGSTGWYWYDPSEETFQKDAGQFSQGGLVNSLQNELSTLKATTAKSLSQRLYIMIGLGVLSVILLILTIVFAAKSKRAGYEEEEDEGFDNEDFDDSDEAEEEPEEEEAEEEEEPEEKPKKRRGLFGRRKREEEEEEDDFDDFVAAVDKKRGVRQKKTVVPEEEDDAEDGENAYDDIVYDKAAYDEDEKPDETQTDETVSDELDIEILDLDDLNL